MHQNILIVIFKHLLPEWTLCYTKFSIIACLKTEWFDTDDPCLVGDFESFTTSTASVASFKRTRRFRSCPGNCVGKTKYLIIHIYIYKKLQIAL